jgi:uncharacterized protein YggL (DUF469 family)
MKKRIRKKKHIGEFKELGFELEFQIVGANDSEHAVDLFFEFLEEAIERNGLFFGGVGKHDRWSGVVHAKTRNGVPTTPEQREAVVSWLEERPSFDAVNASDFFDIWYGELPSEHSAGADWQ